MRLWQQYKLAFFFLGCVALVLGIAGCGTETSLSEMDVDQLKELCGTDRTDACDELWKIAASMPDTGYASRGHVLKRIGATCAGQLDHLRNFKEQYGRPCSENVVLDQLWGSCMDGANADCDQLWEIVRAPSAEGEPLFDSSTIIFAASCGRRIEDPDSFSSCSQNMAWETGEAGVLVVPWETTIRTVCLDGSEQYEGVAQADFWPIRNSFSHRITKIHNIRFHLDVVDQGCDATFSITASGEPLSEFYSGDFAGDFYMGAIVSGEIRLEAEGRPALVQVLEGHRQPPESFGYTLEEGESFQDEVELPENPEDAPFWLTISADVEQALAEWFGPEYPHR